MLRQIVVFVCTIMLLAGVPSGQARAANVTTDGTADGTYDFGSLGAADTAGLGYCKLGDKFKVADGAFISWASINQGALTAINPDTSSTSSYTAVIKAEGGATCKTFTFKDLGISATDTAQSFSSFDIVLKDINGAQIGTTISLGSSAAYSMTSITNISALYAQGPWSVDGVAAIEITYTLVEDGAAAEAWDLNLENITIANVSAPPGPPIVFGVSPASGPPDGGTAVTITGADFTGATGVTFVGINAAGFSVDSPTQITATSPATSPAGFTGLVDVIVTTPLGTSAPSNQFSYSNSSTADGTYDFGSLGANDSLGPGTGYAMLGNKFKVGNSQFQQWKSYNSGPMTAIYPDTNTTSPYTAVIKAEGAATCKTFTFKDLAVSATSDSESFNSASIVLKDSNGVQIGSTISQGSAPIPDASVANLSALFSQGPWSVDGVASIEITYTLIHGDGTPAEAGDLNLENITLANVSAPPGPPVIFGISPSLAPTTGGYPVVITGADFTGATGVQFGGNSASGTLNSSTKLTVTAPPGSCRSGRYHRHHATWDQCSRHGRSIHLFQHRGRHLRFRRSRGERQSGTRYRLCQAG